jgi:hypothetical protein
MEQANDYISIINTENNSLCGLHTKKYQVVENKRIIHEVNESIGQFSKDWFIQPRQSYVDNSMMRLFYQFPDIEFQDDESKMHLGLSVTNSYDGSRSVSMILSFFRLICSNGATINRLVKSINFIHQKQSGIEVIKNTLGQYVDNVPVIQERIKVLNNLEATDKMIEQAAKNFPKTTDTIDKHLVDKDVLTQWQLYNYLTFYISHKIAVKSQSYYQAIVSKMFDF